MILDTLCEVLNQVGRASCVGHLIVLAGYILEHGLGRGA